MSHIKDDLSYFQGAGRDADPEEDVTRHRVKYNWERYSNWGGVKTDYRYFDNEANALAWMEKNRGSESVFCLEYRKPRS